MDISSLTGALSGAVAALDLARAAIGVRDFNKAAAEVASVTQQLLDAQQQLLTHLGTALALQADNASLTKQVSALTAKLDEKERYQLFEIVPGEFVYRSIDAEPLHYVCQRCFDVDGHRSVLQKRPGGWHCTICKMLADRPETLIASIPRSRGPWEF